MSQNMQTLYDQKETAQRLGICTRTLERLRLTGGGPRFVKIGRRVLYREADVDAWLETKARASTSEYSS
jgi:excisionase family DNA binding protein